MPTFDFIGMGGETEGILEARLWNRINSKSSLISNKLSVINNDLAAVSATAAITSNRFAEMGNNIAASAFRLSRFQFILGSISAMVKGVLSVFKAVFGVIKGAAIGIGRVLSRIANSVANMFKEVLSSVVSTVKWATLALAAGAVKMAQVATSLYRERVSQMTALRALSNTPDRDMADIRQLAKAPGLDVSGGLDAFTQLASVGVPRETRLKLIKEMANAVALSGGGPEEFKNAIKGVTQMFGKGKISAEELNQQIFEAAPSARSAMLNAFPGVQNPGDLGKPRKATGGGVIDKRLGYTNIGPTGKMIPGMGVAEFWDKVLVEMSKMPRVADNVDNAMTNLGTTTKELLISLGSGLLGGDSLEFFNGLSTVLEGLFGKFKLLGDAIREALGTLLGTSASDIGSLLDNIVSKLIYGIDWIALNGKTVLKEIFDYLLAIPGRVKEYFADPAMFQQLFNNIGSYLSSVSGSIAKYIVDVFQKVLGYLREAFPETMISIEKTALYVGDIFEYIYNNLKSLSNMLSWVNEIVIQPLTDLLIGLNNLVTSLDKYNIFRTGDKFEYIPHSWDKADKQALDNLVSASRRMKVKVDVEPNIIGGVGKAIGDAVSDMFKQGTPGGSSGAMAWVR